MEPFPNVNTPRQLMDQQWREVLIGYELKTVFDAYLKMGSSTTPEERAAAAQVYVNCTETLKRLNRLYKLWQKANPETKDERKARKAQEEAERFMATPPPEREAAYGTPETNGKPERRAKGKKKYPVPAAD